MNKILITLIIVLLSPLFTTAQDLDSLLTAEMFSFKDTSRIILKNGRSMVFKHIEKDNPEKVNQILNYMDRKLNRTIYPVFTNNEQTLLNFYIGNYAPSLNQPTTRPHDRFYGRGCGWSVSYTDYEFGGGYPDVDYRYPITLDEIISMKDEYILEQIDNSEQRVDDKEFLGLYFKYYIDRWDDHSMEAVKFLNAYPEYRHNDFIKRNIRRWYVRGDESWSLYLGGGSSLFSEGINETINYRGSFTYGADGYFNRWAVGFHGMSNYGNIVQPFTHKGETFSTDWNIYTLNYTINVGFSILDFDFLRITPSIDFGGIYTGIPTSKEEEYEADPSVGAIVYGYGGAIDIFPFIAAGGFYNNVLHRVGIRLHGGRLYNRLDQKVTSLTGHQDYFSISLIYDFGEMVIDMN
ncbi:hypothetical protein [Ekhidna sp.]|jgi:hypothetical protein|uniref:hypothetical protein n=1 Tax=Ekhidna sp. TaxID=2608089 RepID=UPI0032EE1876